MLVLSASLASLNVVWPALVLEIGIFSGTPIALGLIVELFILRWGFKTSWQKAITGDLVMNLCSTVLGIVLIPASGLVWEIVFGRVIHKMFHVGTFNAGNWIATIVIASFVNTLVEALILRFGFKINFNKMLFGLLFSANLLSVSIAFAYVWLNPPRF